MSTRSKPKPKGRTVRAWAVVNDKGRPQDVMLDRGAAKGWAAPWGFHVVALSGTYPKPKAAKKKGGRR